MLACFPPFHLSLLCVVALVPWLIYLSKADGKQAFRSGYIFGLIFWMGEIFFVGSLASHWTGSPFLGAIPYILGCCLAALYFALFGWLCAICYRRNWIWAIPLVWAGVEVFRSYVIGLAFPFGQLASPLSGLPFLIQGAHFGSIFFVSAWVAALNVVGAHAVSARPYREVRILLMLSIAMLAGSIGWFGRTIEGESRRVVAGQPGIDVAFGGLSNPEAAIADRVDGIIAKAQGADLLVLPEGIARSGSQMPPDVMFTLTPSLPTIFGGQRGEKPTYQSAFGYDGSWHYADKTRLVIFGEYVPGRDWIPFLDQFKLPGGDLVPADHVTAVPVGKFIVGGMLCFEGLFPDVAYRQAANGANVLAIMAIDDWYFGTNAPEQLRDASIWRAVETGLPVVRSASMGYTVIIDQRGQIIAEAPLRSTEALGGTIRVAAEPQYFALLPVFPYLSLVSLILVPLADVLLRRRSPKSHEESTATA